jgi:translation initiation factor IF-2
MTETKDTTEKTLPAGARKPLSLQRTVESGHVRQNFSHGRSKSVVVEKRRTRKLGGGVEAEAPPAEIQQPEPPVAKKKPAKSEAAAPEKAIATPAGRTLSEDEREARARALAAARVRDDAERVA